VRASKVGLSKAGSAVVRDKVARAGRSVDVKCILITFAVLKTVKEFK